MIYWRGFFPCPWWRADIDKEDFDFYDFAYFETVTTDTEMNNNVSSVLSPFMISANFRNVLSNVIYKYCFHKLINLRDEKRWTTNFYGDLGIWLLDHARYLQAYDRDINNGIKNKGVDNTDTDTEAVNGSSATNKTGNSSNTQNNSVSVADSQGSTNEVGDTLTVLDNETTSTQFLASKNDESFSRGGVTENASKEANRGNSTSMQLGISNSDSLTKAKGKTVDVKSGTYSNLDIATLESNFKFQPFYYDLVKLLDEYFTLGGSQYA